MRITAKADYAVRAAAELAAAEGEQAPMKGEELARRQSIPKNFLENILTDLRRSGLVSSRRGADGGYQLARPPQEIDVATVIRATDGPLAGVRGRRPEEVSYEGAAKNLQDVWIAVRVSLRQVLEAVTLADIASGDLPDIIRERSQAPGAWSRR